MTREVQNYDVIAILFVVLHFAEMVNLIQQLFSGLIICTPGTLRRLDTVCKDLNYFEVQSKCKQATSRYSRVCSNIVIIRWP